MKLESALVTIAGNISVIQKHNYFVIKSTLPLVPSPKAFWDIGDDAL